jgi:hypothetical protein
VNVHIIKVGDMSKGTADPCYGNKEYEPCPYCEIAYKKIKELEAQLKKNTDDFLQSQFELRSKLSKEETK